MAGGAIASKQLCAAGSGFAIGPDGGASAQPSKLGGHLSERRYSYSFPYVRSADWIIVDRNDQTYGDTAGFRRYIRKYRADAHWRTVYSSRGITVLRKRGTASS